MIDNIGFNSAQFLQLDTSIRTSSTTTFNALEAFENAFEDVAIEKNSKIQEEQEQKYNNYQLGAPAGFFLDTSLLSEEDKLEVNCCSY